MSKLSAFLNPVQAGEKEVYISDRFVDENKNPVPFRIRPITQEENERLSKSCTTYKKVNGQTVPEVDGALLSKKLVVAATVEPDFSNAELCQAYGVIDPSMVPGKMLLSGEYSKLLKEITELSGFGDIFDEAKN